jgi:hypothetical protein
VVAGSVQARFQKNMQPQFLFEADQHRVALFVKDYPTRTRLKLLDLARVLDAREHPPSSSINAPPEPLRRKVERLFLIQVISYDWNCPQYITTRFTAARDGKVCRTAEGPHR